MSKLVRSSDEVLHTSAKDQPAVMHAPYKTPQRDINFAFVKFYESEHKLSPRIIGQAIEMVDDVNLTMLIQPDDDGTLNGLIGRLIRVSL
jgi:hypothetical protein